MRESRGLTALVLAQRAGVHINTVYNVESAYSVSVSALFKIAAALKVRVDDLFSYSQSFVGSAPVSGSMQEKAVKVVCGSEKLF